MVVGNVLTRIIRWIDVQKIHLADLSRRLCRVHQVGASLFGCLHWQLRIDVEGSTRVRLPALHVGCVYAGGVGDPVGSFYYGGEQEVVIVLIHLLLIAPALERLARRVDTACILRREIHPASAGTSSRWREMPTDKAETRLHLQEKSCFFLETWTRGVRDDVGALEYVRRHQQVTRVHTPSFGLERPAHARRSREGVVH